MRKNVLLLALFLTISAIAFGYFFNDQKNTTTNIVTNKIDSESGFKLPATDNIVFLVIDTLRSDHLPFYGYDINTAPFLNELADKSIVFENAFSASSTTAPAMASVFTSTYPSQHGVVMGMQATKRMARQYKSLSINRIPDELLTLGEMMQKAGLKTYETSDNLNIDTPIGYIGGFEKFQTFQYEGAQKINEVALSYYEDLKDKRHFLYLHYMDPHIPYHNREPWFDKNHPNPKIAAYDSEIRYADEHIRQIFEKYQILDNSLVIFLSDHGEELGDHGKYGHGQSLYPEVIKVPLMIYHRNLQPGRVSQTVHTIDVLPTLANILNITPEPYWEGESLTEYFEDQDLTKERTIYSQLLGPKDYVRERFLAAIDQDEWLYIDSINQQRKELFYLEEDPLGFKDLFLLYPEKSTNFGSKVNYILDKQIIQDFSKVDIEMNEKTIDKLKTLGYF